MFKRQYIGPYIVLFLLLVLAGLQAWTYYLGTTDVTFERLTGSKPYPQIEKLSLRRYEKKAISPHLFTMTTRNEKLLLQRLTEDCGLKEITVEQLPQETAETDKEMVEVIGRSPYIYLSSRYDLTRPKEGRMCLVFRDHSHVYLFINGNL